MFLWFYIDFLYSYVILTIIQFQFNLMKFFIFLILPISKVLDLFWLFFNIWRKVIKELFFSMKVFLLYIKPFYVGFVFIKVFHQLKFFHFKVLLNSSHFSLLHRQLMSFHFILFWLQSQHIFSFFNLLKKWLSLLFIKF